MTALGIFAASTVTVALNSAVRRFARREAPSFPQVFKRESRVFILGWRGATKSEDSGLRLLPEWQWGAPVISPTGPSTATPAGC